MKTDSDEWMAQRINWCKTLQEELGNEEQNQLQVFSQKEAPSSLQTRIPPGLKALWGSGDT